MSRASSGARGIFRRRGPQGPPAAADRGHVGRWSTQPLPCSALPRHAQRRLTLASVRMAPARRTSSSRPALGGGQGRTQTLADHVAERAGSRWGLGGSWRQELVRWRGSAPGGRPISRRCACWEPWLSRRLAPPRPRPARRGRTGRGARVATGRRASSRALRMRTSTAPRACSGSRRRSRSARRGPPRPRWPAHGDFLAPGRVAREQRWTARLVSGSRGPAGRRAPAAEARPHLRLDQDLVMVVGRMRATT